MIPFFPPNFQAIPSKSKLFSTLKFQSRLIWLPNSCSFGFYPPFFSSFHGGKLVFGLEMQNGGFHSSCTHKWLLQGNVSDLSGAAAEVSSSVLAPSTGAARSRLKELWVTPLQSLLMFGLESTSKGRYFMKILAVTSSLWEKVTSACQSRETRRSWAH